MRADPRVHRIIADSRAKVALVHSSLAARLESWLALGDAPPQVRWLDVSELRDGSPDPATARAVDDACRRSGFFRVVGHGIPPHLVRDLDRQARRFFALPDAEKDRVAMRHAGAAWRGWFPLGGELTSGRPDQKEGLYFGVDHPRDLTVRSIGGAQLGDEAVSRPTENRGLGLPPGP